MYQCNIIRDLANMLEKETGISREKLYDIICKGVPCTKIEAYCIVKALNSETEIDEMFSKAFPNLED